MKKIKFAAVAGVVGLIAALAGCGGFVYTTVGGTVTGMPANNVNTLVLRNDANYMATLTADGTFAFNVASDASYTISVLTQPLTVYCAIANGTGKMSGSASVTNVAVTCTPSAPVGGTVAGMNTGASITLHNNETNTDTTLQDSLSPALNGQFTFAKYVHPGKPYNISVYVQPPAQNCTVTNGQGVVDSATFSANSSAYSNIASVNCAPAVPVSVALSGLASGASVVLMNNGDTTPINMLTLTLNGNGTFNQSMPDGKAYNVTVNTQPANQICTVTNGSGIASLSNPAAAANIAVTCVNK